MKIIFLSALLSEANEFRKHFNFEKIDEQKKQALYTFKPRVNNPGVKYYWGITGVGPKSCARFLRFISSRQESYDLVILTGYCGGLWPEDKAGSILISQKIHLWENGEPIKIESPGRGLLEQRESCSLKILADASVKKQIRNTYPLARFVDMESYFLAKDFKALDQKIWLVRAVSDGPNFRFPDFPFIQDDWQTLKKKGLLPRLLKRPGQWIPLALLLRNIKRARKSLFKYFEPLIEDGFKNHL